MFANDGEDDINDFDLFQLPKIAESQQKDVTNMQKYSTRREPCGTKLYVHKEKIVIWMIPCPHPLKRKFN